MLMPCFRFYPYHYAPFVSDVTGFGELSIDFKLGTPFHPFEQLLAVLPPASMDLLPRAYQVSNVYFISPMVRTYGVVQWSFTVKNTVRIGLWRAI